MTLDPVHFDGIAQLAGRISQQVDAADHDAFADTVFEEFLDPLWVDGRRAIEPLGELRRRRGSSSGSSTRRPSWTSGSRNSSKTVSAKSSWSVASTRRSMRPANRAMPSKWTGSSVMSSLCGRQY